MWVKQLISNELRKITTYRMDFIVNYIFVVATSFALSYFTWDYIFEVKKTSTINGRTFPQLIFYYFFISNIFKCIQGEGMSAISNEIYHGTLNKYLLYPLSFFKYKYITYHTHTSLYLTQSIFFILIYTLFFNETHISLTQFIFCFIYIYMAATLYFLMNCSLELVAFWVDAVWSLSVGLKMLTSFFNGALIPLFLFPIWAQDIIQYLPFVHLGYYQTIFISGEMPLSLLLIKLGYCLFYILFFSLINFLIWKRGLKKYTGVGI